VQWAGRIDYGITPSARGQGTPTATDADACRPAQSRVGHEQRKAATVARSIPGVERSESVALRPVKSVRRAVVIDIAAIICGVVLIVEWVFYAGSRSYGIFGAVGAGLVLGSILLFVRIQGTRRSSQMKVRRSRLAALSALCWCVLVVVFLFIPWVAPKSSLPYWTLYVGAPVSATLAAVMFIFAWRLDHRDRVNGAMSRTHEVQSSKTKRKPQNEHSLAKVIPYRKGVHRSRRCTAGASISSAAREVSSCRCVALSQGGPSYVSSRPRK
jgi:hypothetical protein